MNSIWNKNISLFKGRFPQLFALISKEIEDFSTSLEGGIENAAPFWSVYQAKNGSVSANEGSFRLHSAYNPEKEAFSTVSSELSSKSDCSALVFMGFGLGYSVIETAKILKTQNSSPKKTIVVIEPNLNYLFAAFSLLDWQSVFDYPEIIFLISCTPEQCTPIFNRFGILNTVFFANKAHTAHAQAYFDALFTLIERNRNKEKINLATTKKFGKRWNMNCLKNAENSVLLDGISAFKDIASDIPFTVIAAGPSLKDILSFLPQLQERTITVCVDTALRACLLEGVQPDFIIITDPQYWAYRHIADLSAPNSILIASSDVYPATFRFNCKKIVCCSSQLPIGKYFERKCGSKGDLGAGGSVASCAWNFAKWCGSKQIFLVGLDLSFPKKQTHFKGSSFEQAAHVSSIKLTTAENLGVSMMFSGNAELGKDYTGSPVVTDQRMKMFAWWFESRIAECPDIKTFTFFDGGLKIPEVEVFSISDVLKFPKITEKKQVFFTTAQNHFKNDDIISSEKKLFTKANELLQEKLSSVDLGDFSTVEKIVSEL